RKVRIVSKARANLLNGLPVKVETNDALAIKEVLCNVSYRTSNVEDTLPQKRLDELKNPAVIILSCRQQRLRCQTVLSDCAQGLPHIPSRIPARKKSSVLSHLRRKLGRWRWLPSVVFL